MASRGAATSAFDPLERALLDWIAGARRRTLRVHSDVGPPARMPVGLFFRAGRHLRPVDRAALGLARGRVLDVGAGAGALALALERAGHDVTALEVLPGAVRAMRTRGVAGARLGDVRSFRVPRPYDTVLSMMNGTAPAGTLAGLTAWLSALAAPMAPDGQVLIDSTDLRTPGGRTRRGDGRYVGEIQYQIEYGGTKGPPFPQLFVDGGRLARSARAVGLVSEIVWRDRAGAYLARLARR